MNVEDNTDRYDVEPQKWFLKISFLVPEFTIQSFHFIIAWVEIGVDEVFIPVLMLALSPASNT